MGNTEIILRFNPWTKTRARSNQYATSKSQKNWYRLKRRCLVVSNLMNLCQWSVHGFMIQAFITAHMIQLSWTAHGWSFWSMMQHIMNIYQCSGHGYYTFFCVTICVRPKILSLWIIDYDWRRIRTMNKNFLTMNDRVTN